MCLAIPLKITEINGNEAVGERSGVRRKIRLDFIENPKLGEYVIVHAGFAIERLGAEQAQKSIRAAEEVENELGSCDVSLEAQKCFLDSVVSKGNDSLLAEGLIRSALNYAANRGAYIAVCKDEKFRSVLELLGFDNNGGEYMGEIPELLRGSCCKAPKQVDIL